VHLLLPQVHVPVAHILVGAEADFLVDRRTGGEEHLSPPPALRRIEHVEQLQAHRHVRIGVVVRIHALHETAHSLLVKFHHLIGLTGVEIDRLGMDEHGCARAIHLSQDHRTFRMRHVEDDVVFTGGAPERHVLRGKGGLLPEIAPLRGMEHSLFLQVVQYIPRLGGAQVLPLGEGFLEGGALHVVHQDVEIVRIDAGMFR